ncbi:hypothetical protein FOCC_FOCC006253 [Frankliniella occidentalis]|nr:hypothetical protein FOCC_FOCC006253 [Frankliniella occidentalis]
MRFNSTKKLCQESLDSLLDTLMISGGGGSRRQIWGEGRAGAGLEAGLGLPSSFSGGSAAVAGGTAGGLPSKVPGRGPRSTLPLPWIGFLSERHDGRAGAAPAPFSPSATTIVFMNLPLAAEILGLPMLPLLQLLLLLLSRARVPRRGSVGEGLPDKCTDCSDGVGVGQLLLEPVAEAELSEPTGGKASAVAATGEVADDKELGSVLDLVAAIGSPRVASSKTSQGLCGTLGARACARLASLMDTANRLESHDEHPKKGGGRTASAGTRQQQDLKFALVWSSCHMPLHMRGQQRRKGKRLFANRAFVRFDIRVN